MIEIGPGITIGGNIFIGDVIVSPVLLEAILITEFYQDIQTESGDDLETE